MVYNSGLAKLKFLHDPYVLAVVSLGYVVGELGHYLIGVTSKYTARDLHYGDISCQLNASDVDLAHLPLQCELANSSEVCLSLEINGSRYCEWDYNGLGLDYQLLAGPSFIAIFTIAGVILGIAADRYNRGAVIGPLVSLVLKLEATVFPYCCSVKILGICSVVFSIAIILMGSVKEYWHLVLLRILLAAGEAACNPMATGILSDIFPEEKRGLVMSIFNWGIYGGYGIAFPVGRYITKMNAFDLGWRLCYYGSGVVSLIFAVLTITTLREPERKEIGEAQAQQQDRAQNGVNGSTSARAADDPPSAWAVMTQPRMILLVLAASIRHCGGMTFAYNCDLYYLQYFPDYDLGWWLFAVTIVVGSIGVVAGGVISDKFVARMGIRSRVAVLAISQLIATPFAFGSVYCHPVGAMVTLGIAYFFAEMWFGIVFAIIVEITPLACRSTIVGVFLFVMNNIGGNLPIAVEPVSKSIGYRESLYVFYVGFYLISSLLFLVTMFFMEGPKKPPRDTGHENHAVQLEMVSGNVEISRI